MHQTIYSRTNIHRQLATTHTHTHAVHLNYDTRVHIRQEGGAKAAELVVLHKAALFCPASESVSAQCWYQVGPGSYGKSIRTNSVLAEQNVCYTFIYMY